MRDEPPGAPPREITDRLTQPDLRLCGEINDALAGAFRDQLARAPNDGPLLVELSTPGGDADVGRLIAQDIRLLREHGGRDLWCLGKTSVYSAGLTILAAFSRERRWLTRDAVLLAHGRRLTRDIRLDGALSEIRPTLEAALAEIDNGLRLEHLGFAELADGSKLSAAEVSRRAGRTWYIPAEEALELGLVAGLI